MLCGDSGNDAKLVLEANGLSVPAMQMEAGGGRPEEGVMVCGDSGNDAELFAVPGVRGCMVANAHPELRTFCDEHASDNLFQVGQPVLTPSCRRHHLNPYADLYTFVHLCMYL